jgi:hypothetical protein
MRRRGVARIKAPMSDANPLENALAWFTSAPARWRSDAEAVAEWVWVVLQGDFAENPTTAQTITGGLISMIPLVDQLSDLRDLVANVRALREDENDPWRWVALAMTLIGLFPTLGSPVKAGLKIVVAEARREVYRAGKLGRRGLRTIEKDGLWKATSGAVGRGIATVGAFFSSRPMRKAMAAQRVDRVFHYLAAEFRALAGSLDAAKLRSAYEKALADLDDLLRWLHRWGGAMLKRPLGELIDTLKWVHARLDRGLRMVTEPLSYWLECVARRLEVEGDMQFRAMVNARTKHGDALPPARLSSASEIELIRRNCPDWVKILPRWPPHPGLFVPPKPPPGHFDIGPEESAAVRGVFKTFSGVVVPDVLPPGTRLVRVVDPRSRDNSPHWMTESEFQAMKSKGDWRAKCAVWQSWNGDGEYVVYVVPPGDGLKVWRGRAASQQLTNEKGEIVTSDSGGGYWLTGGAEQIVVNPADLNPAFIGKRMKTGWTYADADRDDLVHPIGVPEVRNMWGAEER